MHKMKPWEISLLKVLVLVAFVFETDESWQYSCFIKKGWLVLQSKHKTSPPVFIVGWLHVLLVLLTANSSAHHWTGLWGIISVLMWPLNKIYAKLTRDNAGQQSLTCDFQRVCHGFQGPFGFYSFLDNVSPLCSHCLLWLMLISMCLLPTLPFLW